MRYRFVDKIISLEPGEKIEAQRTWPKDLELFKDHFPGFPVVPGVLLTEMMGQAGALCLAAQESEQRSAILLQIKDARFKGWALPDELLTIHAEVVSLQAKLARIKASTLKQGKRIATCELVMAFEENQALGLQNMDPVLEDFLAKQ
ncbi:MAG: 3-hydroxyacyl-ACP dehydratase FabZ family protein [Oleiphilus sp.]